MAQDDGDGRNPPSKRATFIALDHLYRRFPGHDRWHHCDPGPTCPRTLALGGTDRGRHRRGLVRSTHAPVEDLQDARRQEPTKRRRACDGYLTGRPLRCLWSPGPRRVLLDDVDHHWSSGSDLDGHGRASGPGPASPTGASALGLRRSQSFVRVRSTLGRTRTHGWPLARHPIFPCHSIAGLAGVRNLQRADRIARSHCPLAAQEAHHGAGLAWRLLMRLSAC
jgi:hypothetical protein